MNKIQTIIDEIYEENLKFIQKNNYVCGTLSIYYHKKQKEAANMYVSSLKKNFKKYLPNVTLKPCCVKNENLPFLEYTIKEDSSNGIIIMNPLTENNNDDKYYSAIPETSDLDKLSSKYLLTKKEEELPITAYGIFKILERLRNKKATLNVCLIGNGLTVNSHLQAFLLKHKNYNVAVVTRSLEETNNWYSNFISNADVIVSATGIPEFLDSYKFYGKLIISPTIVKNKKNEFCSDVSAFLKDKVDTNNVLGGIGKLTTSELLVRYIKQFIGE
ncbi:bifunctional 5,10-methylenetetrahydrofolate dehydrogenase/5,10-methenyltetrahydrofolate cyclohydrolase [Fusobacterium necrophorum subsp. funduliforme]|uniref:hypothetical protein n=1 Tax=Fusobacterium necrophorum TaxID=859 RepID=UPI00370EC134